MYIDIYDIYDIYIYGGFPKIRGTPKLMGSILRWPKFWMIWVALFQETPFFMIPYVYTCIPKYMFI